jgi:DNA end-binding protein Ku
MHNREHVVILRPTGAGLVLHTLYYANELHQANQAEAPKTKFTAKELELAKSLVSHMLAPFKPAAFHDTYRANVERLIEEKKKGEKITAVKQPRRPPVIDLMEALKRSLKSAPKAEPAARPRKSVHKAA